MATLTHPESPIIDFSAHFYADMPWWEKENSTLVRVLEATEGPLAWDLDTARGRFADAGLDAVVLSQSPYMSHHEVDIVEQSNDALLELIEPHPELLGLGALPVGASGDAGADEFERCLDLGYNGGAIETWFHDDKVSVETLDPVFEVADETGAPLFIHPKVRDSLGPGVLESDYFLNDMFGRGAALSASIYMMIQKGVFDEYPNLNIVVHHMGGNIAGMASRLETTIPRKQGHLEVLDSPIELKSYDEFVSQLRSNVYIDTGGFNIDYDVMQKSMEVLGATNIVFGSDFPCETQTADHYREMIEKVRAAASEEDANRILGQNALELLVNVKTIAK